MSQKIIIGSISRIGGGRVSIAQNSDSSPSQADITYVGDTIVINHPPAPPVTINLTNQTIQIGNQDPVTLTGQPFTTEVETVNQNDNHTLITFKGSDYVFAVNNRKRTISVGENGVYLFKENY